MSIRLAVYCHESRPLDGLCAQLQCAGYDVFERYTETAYRDLLTNQHIDLLMIDSSLEDSLSLIEDIEATRKEEGYRILLVQQEGTILPEKLPLGIDDVIMLPIQRDDLRHRIRAVTRYTAMKAEWDRRRQTLADFEILPKADHQASSPTGLSQVLLIGAIGDEQVALINLLGNTATFSYADTAAHALQVLNQRSFEIVYIGSKVPAAEIQALSEEIAKTNELSDTPFLVSESLKDLSNGQIPIGAENVVLLRSPIHGTGLQRRIQLIMRQYRLRRQLRAMSAEYQHASTIDSLTGLYSRGVLYHYLEQSLERNRERYASLSIATCTISGLDDVNDLLGYPAGDRLIRQLGRALASSCRAHDLVARASSTSFCVVLSDTLEHEARMVCQRTTEILRSIIASNSHRLFHVSLIMGIAEAGSQDKAASLMRKALRQHFTTNLSKAS